MPVSHLIHRALQNAAKVKGAVPILYNHKTRRNQGDRGSLIWARQVSRVWISVRTGTKSCWVQIYRCSLEDIWMSGFQAKIDELWTYFTEKLSYLTADWMWMKYENQRSIAVGFSFCTGVHFSWVDRYSQKVGISILKCKKGHRTRRQPLLWWDVFLVSRQGVRSVRLILPLHESRLYRSFENVHSALEKNCTSCTLCNVQRTPCKKVSSIKDLISIWYQTLMPLRAVKVKGKVAFFYCSPRKRDGKASYKWSTFLLAISARQKHNDMVILCGLWSISIPSGGRLQVGHVRWVCWVFFCISVPFARGIADVSLWEKLICGPWLSRPAYVHERATRARQVDTLMGKHILGTPLLETVQSSPPFTASLHDPKQKKWTFAQKTVR